MAALLDDPTTNLEYLSLEANDVDDRALTIICDSLYENNCLNSINLSNNCITDNGIGKFKKFEDVQTPQKIQAKGKGKK